MKIAPLDFSMSQVSIGLSIVCDALDERFSDIEWVDSSDKKAVHGADYLLVSLYWWRDVYELPRYLVQMGIDPRRRSPIIIIGGMSALNPRVLDGFFHYAILGDGEKALPDLIARIESGDDTICIAGLWDGGSSVEMAACERLQSKSYSIDKGTTTSSSTRIEIMRGCPMRCPFCELSHIKPKRELPFDVIRQLVLSSNTKNINLVSPDLWSHSRASDIIAMLDKLGKNGTGSDVRLDMIKQVKRIERVRFGLEGHSERTRRKIGKIKTNERFLDLLQYMTSEITTRKGNPINNATCYVIGNMPGETKDDVAELWDTLARFDGLLKEKFTLFLSTSSFAPSPFTPMERCGIDPWTPFQSWYSSTRPRYDKLIIATRGAVIAAPQRIAQMLTIRGDEKCSRVVLWLATKAYKLLKSTKAADARPLVAAINKSGFKADALWERLPDDYVLPWQNVSYPVEWKGRWDD